MWDMFGLWMDTFRNDVKNELDKIQVIYRVQTGAFTIKANAENYAKELKNKGFDTYIVKIGDYHKVQVGAYSIRSNADAMLMKLKAAGYEAFITS